MLVHGTREAYKAMRHSMWMDRIEAMIATLIAAPVLILALYSIMGG